MWPSFIISHVLIQQVQRCSAGWPSSDVVAVAPQSTSSIQQAKHSIQTHKQTTLFNFWVYLIQLSDRNKSLISTDCLLVYGDLNEWVNGIVSSHSPVGSLLLPYLIQAPSFHFSPQCKSQITIWVRFSLLILIRFWLILWLFCLFYRFCFVGFLVHVLKKFNFDYWGFCFSSGFLYRK